MISRRFFLEAVGAGLLGASAAGRAVAAVVPASVVPDPGDGGVMEVFTAAGTRLCSVPLRAERLADRVTFSGRDPNVVGGYAAVVRWRLPGGRTLEGAAGCDGACDLHLSTNCFATGGCLDIAINLTMDAGDPVPRWRSLDSLIAQGTRDSWGRAWRASSRK